MANDYTIRAWAQDLAEHEGVVWAAATVAERDRYLSLAAFVYDRVDNEEWVESERFIREEVHETTFERRKIRQAA